jgi:hypothetical protein
VSHDYQVETVPVPVEVTLDGGERLVGQMFLRLYAAGHAGRETIADRLNDDSAFLPLRLTEPVPTTLLVGKAQVRYLVGPDPNGDERIALMRAAALPVEASILLDDGEALTGTMFIEGVPGRTRALDYVNLPDRPFLSLAQPGREYLVNRSRIRYFLDPSS